MLLQIELRAKSKGGVSPAAVLHFTVSGNPTVPSKWPCCSKIFQRMHWCLAYHLSKLVLIITNNINKRLVLDRFCWRHQLNLNEKIYIRATCTVFSVLPRHEDYILAHCCYCSMKNDHSYIRIHMRNHGNTYIKMACTYGNVEKLFLKGLIIIITGHIIVTFC